MKALDNRFYVKFLQLEIGLLEEMISSKPVSCRLCGYLLWWYTA